jgi:hypothetical protein
MDTNRESSRPYAVVCWLLSALFAARVLGQALQQMLPQPFLPPAAMFQGSSLPYGLLLSAQLAILYLMLRATIRLHHGATVPNQRHGIALCAFGAIYMIGAVGRIAIGVALPQAPDWFRAWIPATFHLALAAFLLTLAAFHLLRGSAMRRMQ